MTPKRVVQWLIVVVIMTMILWSVVNVSHYARIYHDSPIVWTFGLSVGIANAVSVYVFVIAKNRQQKTSSVSGILLFGGASGFLQTFLYQHENADLMTAILFGWFGPVAEGVLSWLHASLSVEDDSAVTMTTVSAVTAIDTPVPPVDRPTVIVNDSKVTEDNRPAVKPTTVERRNILRKRVRKGQPTGDDIESWSNEFSVSARTIFRDIEALTESVVKPTNGNGVHA